METAAKTERESTSDGAGASRVTVVAAVETTRRGLTVVAIVGQGLYVREGVRSSTFKVEGGMV